MPVELLRHVFYQLAFVYYSRMVSSVLLHPVDRVHRDFIVVGCRCSQLRALEKVRRVVKSRLSIVSCELSSSHHLVRHLHQFPEDLILLKCLLKLIWQRVSWQETSLAYSSGVEMCGRTVHFGSL